jgi:autotransporter-associated beta strand protein
MGSVTIDNTILQTTGPVTMTGGSIASTGTGRLALQGNVITQSNPTPATISGTLDLGAGNRTFTVADSPAAVDLTIAAIISNGSLTKNDSGTLQLSAMGTYSGMTTINAGTLLVTGSIAGPTTINGGVLGGTGTVRAVTVTTGGIAPGASPGLLTAIGNVSFATGSFLSIELNGPAAGTEYDQLKVNGTVTLNNADLTGTLGTGFTPIAGTQFIIVDNDGVDPISGTFNGLAEGSVAVIGGLPFTVSYIGGTGNDVVLTRVAAPRVLSTLVNQGATQRSRVTSITVTFDTVVAFASTPGAAFTLIRNSDSAIISFTATASVVGGMTVVTLDNFTGTATEFLSLADGRYTLTALANQITAGGVQLDGNGDGTPGDNFTFGDPQGLFRFFGDINGDRNVDIADFGVFSSTFGLTSGQMGFISAFDYNQDGVIDIADFGQFSIRIFTVLP